MVQQFYSDQCCIIVCSILNSNINMKIRIADLFAGIGGFHLAFHNLGAETVWASENDANARKTYEANYKKINPKLFESGNFAGDITLVNEKELPDFDIICGGFPCQPFSNAGFKKGFEDTRGTLFFDIVRIIKEKKPKAFFLENVSHFEKHDNGKTYATIKKTLEDLGYSFHSKIVKAEEFGLPQRRRRLYMVGFLDKDIPFEFPKPIELKLTMSDIWGGVVDKKVGYTLRVGGRGSGIKDRRNWDGYIVDGVEKRLSPVEGKKMMGFPEDFIFPVSNVQAMKQLGNSVAVPAIQATANNIIKSLNEYYDNRQ